MIIFIAGAHATGKTYLCEKAIKNRDLQHSSCSKLISIGRKKNWDDDKCVDDIDLNQKILISELRKIKDSGNNLLLDGHFVLVSGRNKFSTIEKDVFTRMEIDAIILIECQPEIIEERFQARNSELIFSPAELMSAEKKQASSIAKDMKIPIVILHSPTSQDFYETIEKIIQSGRDNRT